MILLTRFRQEKPEGESEPELVLEVEARATDIPSTVRKAEVTVVVPRSTRRRIRIAVGREQALWDLGARITVSPDVVVESPNRFEWFKHFVYADCGGLRAREEGAAPLPASWEGEFGPTSRYQRRPKGYWPGRVLRRTMRHNRRSGLGTVTYEVRCDPRNGAYGYSLVRARGRSDLEPGTWWPSSSEMFSAIYGPAQGDKITITKFFSDSESDSLPEDRVQT